MKVAILSDIHANIEALEAVLADAQCHGAETYCALGDFIGFNGDPAACIEVIRPLLAAAVRGNHEAALLQRGLFRVPLYTTMMDRTAAMLNAGQIAWLRALPQQCTCHGMRLVHASLPAADTWQRIATTTQAQECLQSCAETICLFGHTHRPAIYRLHGGICTTQSIVYDADGSFRMPLDSESRYLINPGAVGQPRDLNWKAAYGLIDTEDGMLLLRRVDYDVHTAAAKIERTGLPESFATALLRGASPTGD